MVDRKVAMAQPWPSNLLAFVNGERPNVPELIDYPVSPEHTEYLVEVLHATLQERHAQILLAHFRAGRSQHEIAHSIHVSAQRVNQLISRSLETLRRPTVQKKILYGPQLTETANALQRRKQKLDDFETVLMAREEVLEDYEKLLRKRLNTAEKLECELRIRARRLQEAGCDVIAEGLPTCEATPHSSEEDVSPTESALYDTRVENLGLCQRAYNALWHGGCHNFREVVECVKEGRLLKVRNLGTKMATQVLAKVYALTGQDYSGLYRLKL